MNPALNLQQDNRHRIAIAPDWNPLNMGVVVLVTSPRDRQYR
jgi:hypothetical protein